MKINTLALYSFLLFAAAAPAAWAVPGEADMKMAYKDLNALYSQGQEFMARSDWGRALDRFRSLEARMIERGEANVDTAVFWQAYVLVQARRIADARRQIDRLREKYPQSRWIAEAETLLVQNEARSEAENTGASTGGDKELAEIAVEGLISAPPERALPLLRKVLKGQQPEKVKRRALFVLTQLDSREAMAEIVEVARSGDPALRDEAIRMLGVSGDDAALTELAAFYKSTGAEGRREVLQAWMIADREDLLCGAARDESDPSLREEAIQLLGAMGATAELRELLPAVKEPELQVKIVESLGIAGDIDGIVQVLAGNLAPSARLEAYRAIGIGGGKSASDALVGLYPRAASTEERGAILEGLLIADDAKAMTSLYKLAKTKEEKQQILRMLTTMDNDAAIDVIEQELN